MHFDVHWIDVNEALKKGEQPVYMLPRPFPPGSGSTVAQARVGEFWVPTAPLNTDQPDLAWSVTKEGDVVRIPVHAYRTKNRSMAAIYGMALQHGLRAAHDLREKSSERLVNITLVLGSEVHDVTDGFRAYAGLAIRTK